MAGARYPYIQAYLVGLKKKIGLEQQAGTIENLILGCSHGQYSYIPQQKEYNLCLPSQDLYYSYALYKKYAGQLKNLKHIVLFYSVFSCGYELVKTKEDFRCWHYEQIFKIKPNHRKYLEILHTKYGKFSDYIQERGSKLHVAKNYRGENPDKTGKNVWRIGKIEPQERALGALKHNKRGHMQDKYVEKLINLAQKHGVEVTVILSPAHVEYRKVLPPEEKIFAHIREILSHYPKIKMPNFYNYDNFADECWWDYDHLNPIGAKKFTKLYHQIKEE